MLFVLNYHFNDPMAPDVEFFETLLALGKYEDVFDGCLLLETEYTAVGIRKTLMPFFSRRDKLVIGKLYKGHCAGIGLAQAAKDFISEFQCADPYPFKPEFKG